MNDGDYGVGRHASERLDLVGEQLRIGELKMRVAQHHECRGALRRFGQLEHGAADATIGRGHDEGDLAVLPERALDEVLDEHASPRNRDHEPPQPERAQVAQRPVNHGPSGHRHHRRAADVR